MAVWEKTAAALALQMTRATFDTWLRGSLLLSLENGCATLGVRHPHGAEWVQHRLQRLVLAALSRALGQEVQALRVVVLDEVERGGSVEN
jgi:chromosomal replication initiator protein